VLTLSHDTCLAGHRGSSATVLKVRRHFVWYMMTKVIKKYCKSCHICQIYNYRNQAKAGAMAYQPKQSYPWQRVSVDLIGPLPLTRGKNHHLLVFVDTFSGWPEAFALRNPRVDAKVCIAKAIEVFSRWGFPQSMNSDNGPQFVAQIWYGSMKAFGVRATFSTAHHPESNRSERTNRDIVLYLSKYVEKHDRWDEDLHAMLFSIRSSVLKSTGYTPAMLNLGREMYTPFDSNLQQTLSELKPQYHEFIQSLTQRLEKVQQFAKDDRELAVVASKMQFDKHRKYVEFYEGQMVYIDTFPMSDAAKKISAKLSMKREGPYLITHKRSPLVYVVSDPVSKEPIRVTHINQITLATVRDPVPEVEPLPSGTSTKVPKQVGLRKRAVKKVESKIPVKSRDLDVYLTPPTSPRPVRACTIKK
jgi:hypothetical protein